MSSLRQDFLEKVLIKCDFIGVGINDEHLIVINLEIKKDEVLYKDSFDWDIINENNM
jgi:hypothetical protein